MENPIKMDDLEVSLFLETSIKPTTHVNKFGALLGMMALASFQVLLMQILRLVNSWWFPVVNGISEHSG